MIQIEVDFGTSPPTRCLGTLLTHEVAVALHSTIGLPENERSWAELISQLARGDENALAQLYDSTNRMVYGLALRILGDPSSAEDVAMEVYLQVWRTAGSFVPERGTVSSWLVTMVRSRAIDCLRARKARRKDLEQDVDDVHDLRHPGPSPELAVVETGRSHIVQKAMRELPSEQRQAIELAYFSGLSHSEVALQTGLPLGTVKTRIRSGMMRPRELLEPLAGGL
jgi:RNA polymerase sigma-70 factor (ECF subfamily)